MQKTENEPNKKLLGTCKYWFDELGYKEGVKNSVDGVLFHLPTTPVSSNRLTREHMGDHDRFDGESRESTDR